MTSAQLTHASFPLSCLSIGEHYNAVIKLDETANASLRQQSDGTYPDLHAHIQCEKYESAIRTLRDRCKLPEIVNWSERLKGSQLSSGSPWELLPEMEAFDTWDSRLHKVQAEYMTYALPKYDFRSTFESTLTDCIQSTRSTKTKLDSYNWVAQSGILIPTNQMEEVKSSVFETEDKYRKFEEVNGGKLFEEVMTPTSPWTLERTENLDKKWKEWLTLTGDALAIGEAKNYFLRQSMMMNGQMF